MLLASGRTKNSFPAASVAHGVAAAAACSGAEKLWCSHGWWPGQCSAPLASHSGLRGRGYNACIQPVSPVCCLTMITYQNCSPAFPATIHLSLLAAKPSIFPPAAWDHGRKLRGGWVLGRCSGYITHMHHSGIYCPFDKRVLLSHFYFL